MRRFYVLLAVVCVAGVAWLVYSTRRTPAPALGAAAPVPVAVNDGFRGFTLGSDSAPVEITEYSDFECPFCAAFATVQMPVVRQQLIATGKVRFRFRDFPLSSHRYSRPAALAAACAGEQGKFWEMHDHLFGQRQWTEGGDPTDAFRGFAKDIGLNLDQYEGCMKSQRYAGRIEASYEEGEARGVQGTPTLFIDDRKFQGGANSDALKAIVDSLITARVKR